MGEARRRRLIGDGKPNRDVVIGYCRPEDVDGMFFDAVTGMLLYDREHDQRIASTIGVEGGPRVFASRNQVVRQFLKETDAEWLCWLDADMVPPPDMIDALLAVADPKTVPIVGALCFAGGRTTIKPTIYRVHRDGDKITSDCAIYYQDNSLIEVDATGAACLLTHRSVYERIEERPEFGATPHPWFQDQVISGEDFGEDIVFCLRAKTVGARIWIHTGVKVGHRKKRVMDQREFVDFINRIEAVAPDALEVAEGEREVLLTPEQFAALGAKAL